jgi:hypothetical protein
MREFVSEYGRGVRQENVRSKTKEVTRTLPYSLSMRPAAVTASEEVEDIVLECQTVNAPNVNLGNSVRVRVLYRIGMTSLPSGTIYGGYHPHTG